MWSEHCLQKHQPLLLKTFPPSRRRSSSAGEENAGIIDIGDNIAIAFKIESHNHPSAVEPFQARPPASAASCATSSRWARRSIAVNSLRFGRSHRNPEVAEKMKPVVQRRRQRHRALRQLLRHPDHRGRGLFRQNPRGQSARERFASACCAMTDHAQRGEGVSNPVFYVGPATGRDGLAGAAFASQDLTEESAEQQRGAVQVGDPFMEKTRVRSVPRIARHRRSRRHAGHGRGGFDLFHLRKWPRAPARASRSNSTKFRSAPRT